jgi:hypothetical protein
MYSTTFDATHVITATVAPDEVNAGAFVFTITLTTGSVVTVSNLTDEEAREVAMLTRRAMSTAHGLRKPVGFTAVHPQPALPWKWVAIFGVGSAMLAFL